MSLTVYRWTEFNHLAFTDDGIGIVAMQQQESAHFNVLPPQLTCLLIFLCQLSCKHQVQFIHRCHPVSVEHDLVTTTSHRHSVHLEVAVSVVTLQLLTVEVVCPCDCL